MEECIFCKIISKEIPAEIVYEDENSLAFLDIHPNTIGHTLVIPKVHSRNLLEIEEKDLHSIISVAKKISNVIRKGLKASGINVSINNGSHAGQIVFHTHIHIIPRYSANEFTKSSRKEYADGEAKDVASKIRAVL